MGRTILASFWLKNQKFCVVKSKMGGKYTENSPIMDDFVQSLESIYVGYKK